MKEEKQLAGGDHCQSDVIPQEWSGAAARIPGVQEKINAQAHATQGGEMNKATALLMLVAAAGVLYSGLFLLDLAPGRPSDSFRFWNGGETALKIGGAVDIAAGIPLLALAAAAVLNPATALQRWKAFAALYAAGIAGDLIAGIYGIMAQAGLYTTLFTAFRARRST
ncbi:MAG: hypothetical protein QXS12_05250 [Candidatus Caldarchaeum sp.]